MAGVQQTENADVETPTGIPVMSSEWMNGKETGTFSAAVLYFLPDRFKLEHQRKSRMVITFAPGTV